MIKNSIDIDAIFYFQKIIYFNSLNDIFYSQIIVYFEIFKYYKIVLEFWGLFNLKI